MCTMVDILLMKNILEYFIDLDNIAKKKEEMQDASVDCIGLDLQFYFEEREKNTQKLLQKVSQYKDTPSEIKIAEYFKWLVHNFRKLVDESESNCNKWQSETGNLEQKRIEIDQILKHEEEITL